MIFPWPGKLCSTLNRRQGEGLCGHLHRYPECHWYAVPIPFPSEKKNDLLKRIESIDGYTRYVFFGLWVLKCTCISSKHYWGDGSREVIKNKRIFIIHIPLLSLRDLEFWRERMLLTPRLKDPARQVVLPPCTQRPVQVETEHCIRIRS